MAAAQLYQSQLAPVAQVDAQNKAVSVFVYASHGHVPDYMVKNGVTYRLVVDHLGSVREVVNVVTGSIAQRIDYDEFGNMLSDTNPGFQPFAFAGGLYDTDTHLTRIGERDYDPETGRWTAKDPILFEGGTTNLFEYIGDDPINSIDPSGLTVYRCRRVADIPANVIKAFGLLGTLRCVIGFFFQGWMSSYYPKEALTAEVQQQLTHRAFGYAGGALGFLALLIVSARRASDRVRRNRRMERVSISSGNHSGNPPST